MCAKVPMKCRVNEPKVARDSDAEKCQKRKVKWRKSTVLGGGQFGSRATTQERCPPPNARGDDVVRMCNARVREQKELSKWEMATLMIRVAEMARTPGLAGIRMWGNARWAMAPLPAKDGQ